MRNIWLVARNEYIHQVKKKNFIMSLLSIPIVMILILGLSYIVISVENPRKPVGYVDNARFLSDSAVVPLRAGIPTDSIFSDRVELISFRSEEEARKALDSGAIQAYYLIGDDYLESNNVELVYYKKPGQNAKRYFWDLMQFNKIRDIPYDKAMRAVAGTNMVIRWPEESPGGAREFSEDAVLKNLIPLIFAFIFIITIFLSSSYFMSAFLEEKENRTIEILMTSVSSYQFVWGKIMGILGLIMTLLLTWFLLGLFAFLITAPLHGFPSQVSLMPDLQVMLYILFLGIPSFIIIASFMIGVGSVAIEHREAQQLSTLVILPMWAPFWLAGLFIKNPNGPLALALSFFPPTSFSTFCFRLTFYNVPRWQVMVAIVTLAACAIMSLFLVGRVFRFGMLRYGKKFHLREIFIKILHA